MASAVETLLTPDEVAERLRLARSTVYKLISSGIMPSVRVSPGAIRIEADELDEWLVERRTGKTTVGGGSSAEAVGLSSSVDAGAPSPARNPAAHAWDPESSAGSRIRAQRAGDER